MNVPIILNYDFMTVIGRAEVQEDGTAVLTIQDPRIVEMIQHQREIVGFSVTQEPARQADMDDILDEEERLEKERIKQLWENTSTERR